ncbi:MAG: DHH family phosphoesterase [Promethearchaeota archaeon]
MDEKPNNAADKDDPQLSENKGHQRDVDYKVSLLKNSEFIDFSRELYTLLGEQIKKGRKLVVVSHDNVDFDGISSLFAIQYLVGAFFRASLGPDENVDKNIYYYSISENKGVQNLFKEKKYADFRRDFNDLIDFLKNEGVEADKIEVSNQQSRNGVAGNKYLVILVDSNKLEDILKVPISINEISGVVIIDHHEHPNRMESPKNVLNETGRTENINIPMAKGTEVAVPPSNKNEPSTDKILDKILLFYTNPDASSVSELIAALWIDWSQRHNPWVNEDANDTPKDHDKIKIIADLLVIGIMSDSVNFKYSHSWIFEIMHFLVENGGDIEEFNKVNVVYTSRRDYSERIARIKGAIRSKEIFKINNWLVLFTRANSFEASICNALIELGADIALCLSKQKHGEYRIIGRCSDYLQNNSSFNLGIFMDELSEDFEGTGGGHKGAAGFAGKNFPEKGFEYLKSNVIRKLRKKLIK